MVGRNVSQRGFPLEYLLAFLFVFPSCLLTSIGVVLKNTREINIPYYSSIPFYHSSLFNISSRNDGGNKDDTGVNAFSPLLLFSALLLL